MKASSTKMEPTGGNTKNLILQKVDLTMPPHATISWIASFLWINTRPSRYTPISRVLPIPHKSALLWRLWMVRHLQSTTIAADYWLQSSRYYNSREPTWLRSVIDSIPCGLEQESWTEWRFPVKPLKSQNFPTTTGVGTRHFSRFRHILIVSNILYTKNGSESHKISHLPLPATLFRFYATSWLSSKSWTDRGTAVCGAQVVGKSLHMDGFSVSDLRFLMWGGSCKSGWNNCLSRFSPYFFLVTHLTDILRDAVTKGREYVLFYCILCLFFAGLLEGGGGSECSLFTCSVGFVLCSTPFEEQGGHVL